ncbi:Sh3 domain-containing protein [Lasiodiplodia theobromae]|uniref:Sh3 domain-containing protein n=1 Tax=Lasiodiplodia theobromae TaxID=45133 RepID=UPI0015C308D1|nr:Sh3 domain-containing protein [Lasiodiplodia theobromae]KAF4540308.1 Sh3 domain-containing protein [Lasiodiplodia theobromae]
MAAVVPHHHQEDGNQQVTVFASDLHQLTSFFNEEILSLRKDMEMLKQGGWTVTVGAFQPSKTFDLTEVNATRERLQKSSGFLGALMAKSSANAMKQVEGPPSPPNTPNRNGSGLSTAPAVQPPNGVFGAKPDGFLDSKDDTNDSDPKSPPVNPDTPIPSTEDLSFVHMSSAGNWQPLAIRSLRPLDDAITSTIPSPSTMQTFSWDFIRKFLLGKVWSPGFYYHPVAEGVSIMPSRTYYLLDASTDPYLPRSPAAHGAKLTAFFNPENPEDVDGDEAAAAFDNVPVFVAASDWAKRHKLESDGDEVGGRKEYLYMGMYSQLRFSDKLDYDRQVEQVPDAVKMYWAEQLADVARPSWVTEALMKAFVPKPEYEGHLPGLQGAEDDVVRQEIGRHVRDLREWEELARKKVGKLTKEKVLQAFAKEDAADPPGLRLWWEYLQCTGWDRGFYDMLVREQQKWVEKEKRVVKSMA